MKRLSLAVLLSLAACDEKPMPPPDMPPPCEEPLSVTCGTACGTRVNSCGLTVACASCGANEECVSGACQPAQGCVPDMMSACSGRQCGSRGDGCDASVSCGTCMGSLSCSADGLCVATDAGVSDGGTADGGIACPVTRVSNDRADESTLPRVRLMYVIPSDLPDESLDVNGKVCNSGLAFNTWLERQVGKKLRFDVSNGELDIGFVRLNKTNAEMRGSTTANDVNTGVAYVRERIERELRSMNAIAPDKLYAVFYGGESSYACGGAAYPPALVGQVIAMYLKSSVGGVSCEARAWGQPSRTLGYFDWAMMHDLLHGLGIVPSGAPNQHTFGHAFDVTAPRPEVDLMYTPRPGQSDPPWGIDADGGLVLDLNHDDYFRHDAGFIDLERSAFLDPLPTNAVRPPGW